MKSPILLLFIIFLFSSWSSPHRPQGSPRVKKELIGVNTISSRHLFKANFYFKAESRHPFDSPPSIQKDGFISRIKGLPRLQEFEIKYLFAGEGSSKNYKIKLALTFDNEKDYRNAMQSPEAQTAIFQNGQLLVDSIENILKEDMNGPLFR